RAGGPEPLLQDREPGSPARDRSPSGGRGRGGEAPRAEPSPVVRRDDEGRAAAPEASPQAISERLLALATLARDSEHVVRRAWRSAQRLDADLDVLVVRPRATSQRRGPPAAGGAQAAGFDAGDARARGGRRGRRGG